MKYYLPNYIRIVSLVFNGWIILAGVGNIIGSRYFGVYRIVFAEVIHFGGFDWSEVDIKA